MTQESISGDFGKNQFPTVKGISKNRLRVRGRKVKSTAEVKQWIFELVAAAPRTPKQLQSETGFSAMHVWRYTKQLLQEGKIEKDGHILKKKGLSNLEVRLERINELNKESFAKIPFIHTLIENMKRPGLKSGHASACYSTFRSICLGKVVSTFKCHPEDWHAHETTITFRNEYFKARNTERLPQHIRRGIRAFYQLCLKYPLSEMEALQLGIDGGKGEIGKYADCRFSSTDEFEALIEYYLRSNNLELAAYVAFATETFGRPERVFQASREEFRFVKERVQRTRATWDSDWSFDPRLIADRRMQMELYPALRDRIAIETLDLEILEGKMHESKTNVTWPKEIRNPLAVSVIKGWLATFEDRNKIFGTANESFSQFAGRINSALRVGYRAVGLTHPYFSKRPSYALRHCGAHLWLVRTGYNYDAVASMGWEDINTLRLFYGKYDPSQRKQSYKVAY